MIPQEVFDKLKSKEKLTIGDLYHPAMEVETQEEADRYLEALISRNMIVGSHTREEAKRIELINIGYFSGYFDRVTATRVMVLFRTAHPIFGTIFADPGTAYKMGLRIGKEIAGLRDET